MSDSNSIRVNERTSLNVYEADIFICSRQRWSIGGFQSGDPEQVI
jgi:hypothetical protein